MDIKIFKFEAEAGLSDAIIENSTIAYSSPAMKYNPSDEEILKTKAFLAKAESQDQIDLYYLQSVLVSTGWNKNDDVFDPQETWAARKSPEDKQFNYMHNEKDIIGHITANCVVDFDGNGLADDMNPEVVPSDFNIITNAVLYTSWGDPQLKERMSRIIAEIEDGRWFVSMECLFPNFDYALESSEGETKVVHREEASAFLTQHLRAYGGNGEYEGYKVGRLLRSISFSGKGLVARPANPRSVILNGNKDFNASKSQILTVSSMKETNMSDILEKQVEDLKAELAQSQLENETMKQEVEAQKDEAIKATIAEKEEALADFQKQLDEATATMEELQKSLSDMTAEKEQHESKIQAMELEAMLAKRQADLTDAGLEEAEAQEALEKFATLGDEAFEQIIALIKSKSLKKKALETEEEKEADEVKPKGKASEETEEETDEAEAEAEAEVLEEAEEVVEAALAESADDDSISELRSSASEWFGSLLKSTPKAE
tara:strand:+ start:1334 stop:2800 length:1467 start_codon:yes stop_codon:yes gene_type:complete